MKLLGFMENAKYQLGVVQQIRNSGKSIANTLTYILETCRRLEVIA